MKDSDVRGEGALLGSVASMEEESQVPRFTERPEGFPELVKKRGLAGISGEPGQKGADEPVIGDPGELIEGRLHVKTGTATHHSDEK